MDQLAGFAFVVRKVVDACLCTAADVRSRLVVGDAPQRLIDLVRVRQVLGKHLELISERRNRDLCRQLLSALQIFRKAADLLAVLRHGIRSVHQQQVAHGVGRGSDLSRSKRIAHGHAAGVYAGSDIRGVETL